jgi:hypothetical protein
MGIPMNELRLSICILALLVSCSGPGATVIPKPDDAPSCGAACSRMRELGCREAAPLEDGTSCEVFCQKTLESGHPLRPSCVQTIQSCNEVDACSR